MEAMLTQADAMLESVVRKIELWLVVNFSLPSIYHSNYHRLSIVIRTIYTRKKSTRPIGKNQGMILPSFLHAPFL